VLHNKLLAEVWPRLIRSVQSQQGGLAAPMHWLAGTATGGASRRQLLAAEDPTDPINAPGRFRTQPIVLNKT
jgi:hypothetical protein